MNNDADFYQKYKNKFKIVKYFIEIIFLFTILCYLFGFLFWNIYLSNFGFFEHNLIQTRFISAGFLFLFAWAFSLYLFYAFFELIASLLFGLKKLLLKLSKNRTLFYILNNILFKELNYNFYIGTIVLIIILFFVAVLWLFPYFFPKIAQYYGGARPYAATIIDDDSQKIKEFFPSFEIGYYPNADGKDPVQTQPVCILYQSKDYYIVGVISYIEKEGNRGYTNNGKRVLIFNQDTIKSLQTRGGEVSKTDCSNINFINI